jgi:crossover junction endodeoxyribonuclease RusA
MDSGCGSRQLELVLPYPPSVNKLYRTVHNRIILSKAGRQYKIDCTAAILTQGKVRFSGRVAYVIYAHMPDRRTRDLSNLTKIVEDTLTYAGVWDDDSQVDDMRVVRAECVPDGKLVMRIEEIRPA